MKKWFLRDQNIYSIKKILCLCSNYSVIKGSGWVWYSSHVGKTKWSSLSPPRFPDANLFPSFLHALSTNTAGKKYLLQWPRLYHSWIISLNYRLFLIETIYSGHNTRLCSTMSLFELAVPCYYHTKLEWPVFL